MEVHNRRNKHNDPCLVDWMNFDDIVLKRHLEKVGCRAPYQNSDKPLCHTKESMAESVYEITKVKSKYCPAPCQEMSNIRYELEIVELLNEKLNISELNTTLGLSLSIYYPKRVKLITQSQSINVQALIGNIGGYLGLFLGKI